jgi:hypothetical protein
VPSAGRCDPEAGCKPTNAIAAPDAARSPLHGAPPGDVVGATALHSLASYTKLRPASCALLASRFYQQRARGGFVQRFPNTPPCSRTMLFINSSGWDKKGA